MTINKEIVKEKWERAKKFVKDHPLQIAAGVGTVAGLYLGCKFGVKIGKNRGAAEMCQKWLDRLPGSMDAVAERSYDTTLEHMKMYAAEGYEQYVKYVGEHMTDKDFIDAHTLFWNSADTKEMMTAISDLVNSTGLSIDWEEVV